MFFAVLITTALGSLNPHTLKGRDALIARDMILRGDLGRNVEFLSPEFARDVMGSYDMMMSPKYDMMMRSVPAPMGFQKLARGNCIADDQCYNGDNARDDCCSGAVTNSAGDIIACTSLNQCNMCTQIASTLVKSVAASGSCAAVGVASVCGPILASLVVSAGTSAPLAAACAIAVPSICSAVLKAIARFADPEDHVTQIANDACQTVGFCSGGSNEGNIRLGQACGCVPSGNVFGFGSCASDVSHCCSGKKKGSFSQAPCVPPLVKCTD